jgi:hypothetical protein
MPLDFEARNGQAALQVRPDEQSLFYYHEPSRHRRSVAGASDARRIP